VTIEFLHNPFVCIEVTTRLFGVADALATAAKLGNHRDYHDDGAQAWDLASMGRTRLRAHPLSESIFGKRGVIIQLLARLAFGVMLFFFPNYGTAAGLIATIVVLNFALAFRDSYLCDSASDRLRTMVGLALLVRFMAPDSQSACVATILFISFNAAGSYTISVFAKLKDSAWVDGSKVFCVLNNPFFRGCDSITKWLFRHPKLCRAMTWHILAFELSFPISLVVGGGTAFFLVSIGVLFHACNRAVLKLPGFLLAYITTYPAILFVGQGGYCR
jgi:hypothetical protein